MSKLKHIRLVIAGVIIVAGLAVAGFLWYRHTSSQLSDVAQVEKAVSRHYLLPADEEPALLTVVDKTKVTSAALKGKVENNDKVLLYKDHHIAVVYRPSIDRIVEVEPLVIDDVKATE